MSSLGIYQKLIRLSQVILTAGSHTVIDCASVFHYSLRIVLGFSGFHGVYDRTLSKVSQSMGIIPDWCGIAVVGFAVRIT